MQRCDYCVVANIESVEKYMWSYSIGYGNGNTTLEVDDDCLYIFSIVIRILDYNFVFEVFCWRLMFYFD